MLFTKTQVVITPASPEDSGFDLWRKEARHALLASIPPQMIQFLDATAEVTKDMFTADHVDAPQSSKQPHAPRAFMQDAELVACHRNIHRWEMLYSILHRLQTNRDLIHIESDPDIACMKKMVGQIRHDIHKAHAFVRFKAVQTDEGEHFVAYHQPAHRILPLAAPFFAERFKPMRWSILTPDCCAHWNPMAQQLTYTEGLSREHAPAEDELETLWKSYYASIFNPARLNEKTMRQHMPTKYWANLPEINLLQTLIPAAENRVQAMVVTQKARPTAAPFLPEERSLPSLREAISSCKGCDLYRHATQAVFGHGASNARLMLVGEQPGDLEDVQGQPFVGPAGKLLRQVLAEIDIDPETVYMTNAVKHFRFVQIGDMRQHRNPGMTEINACRPWLEAEIATVKPSVILCLGASAAKSLLGGTFRLMEQRGSFLASKYAEKTIATLHPSAILRARDEESRHEMRKMLTADLLLAHREANRAA